MRKYFRHLYINLNMSWQSAAEYRIDFIMRILRALIEIVSLLILVNVYFSHTDSIAGWTQPQVMLVFALALFVVSFVMFFWGNGIENLYLEVNRGTLDRLLLQPMDTQWLACTRIIYITNIFRLLFSLGFVIYVAGQLNLAVSMVNLLLFIVNLISAIIMFYSLMFAVSVISFWAFSGELYYLFNSLTAISRYPLDIFSKGVQLVLTVIPVIFIATIPAKILIGPPPLLSFAAPVIALIFFVIVRRFWFLGLRSYESASS